jgi:rhodanese-related sulfurtransferase
MQTVDHRGVLRLQDERAQVVEVLPAHEFRSAHIQGAIHLPLAKILGDAPGRLTRDVPVVVYCRDSL